MRKSRRRARFAREAVACVRNIEIAGEDLDRDEATKDWIVGGIDGAHTSTTKPPLDFVTPYLSAGLEHGTPLPLGSDILRRLIDQMWGGAQYTASPSAAAICRERTFAQHNVA
jgi:hypothetical protein